MGVHEVQIVWGADKGVVCWVLSPLGRSQLILRCNIGMVEREVLYTARRYSV